MTTAARTLMGAVAIVLAATATRAAEWTPPGPISMLIGFRAGGGADTQARLIAQELEARHGWTIQPQQVTGKGGLNLAAALKDAPVDGTVIGMVVTETLGYNMAAAGAGLHPDDFTGITTTAGFQMGVVARRVTGWATLEDAIAAAKGGAALRFGVMSPRLADLAYLLGKAQGVTFNIVEMRGGKAVMDGINAGDLDLGFVAGIQAASVAAGDLVNLASALSVPLNQTPEAPTFATLGVDFNADGQFMFVGPAGMSTAARSAMSTAIAEIISDPQTGAGALIASAFGGPSILAGDALQAQMAADYDAAGALLAAASE
ncbi:tripartite tricarboxylate transporter substrate-binding protein [uncultured Tateyamaria sp.]|uniref:Bug family tripartite tricarboxylate transporter substrate binding protein n=1 Tax=uncultured Tateyamaria sp. TaxID=455651 RepID=UPI00262B5A82|nr:tripartite tricarboxylate transporter substrate-binding protein [uncultured Tateyamaria sp.]